MYWIKPEVAGGLAEGSDYDVTRDPQLVGPLHYEFADWLGDDIVTTAGFWLVTDRLAAALRAGDVTGWDLGVVHVSRSEELVLRKPDLELPHWNRLLPHGVAGDDIVLVHRVYLCVSERALSVLRSFNLANARMRDESEIPPPIR
ncbi:hypothetical protein [Cellulomonas xiejunii]|uniref:Uncharacterized protein n=1 Tax=Cellulomonas xiejunii TaxID=2968083 RepID=A0ABY5KNA0_9CELL|nr:hypothetical protein [Cellulomonas xiejunii]MCC2321356.1 hypothetical protein [Cellulomonas xiejunii]UUI71941.1 hypothetical protein NP048_00230 [Cellulomonas xiejunii]